MADTYTQLYIYIVFHTKNAGIMRDEDLGRVFQYIGGIIQDEGAMPLFVSIAFHNLPVVHRPYGTLQH